MPLNPALVGKTYPAVTFTVEEERVRLFAGTVGERTGIVPPTFATAPEIAGLDQVIRDEELGLDFARVLHGEQEYEWHRPLSIGDVLTVTPRVAAVRARGTMEFLVIETEMRDASGEMVVGARDTLVVRGEA